MRFQLLPVWLLTQGDHLVAELKPGHESPGRARHADVFVVIRIVFNLKSFGFNLRFGIIPLHMLFIEKKARSMGLLAPGIAYVNWNVAYYKLSRNIASYSICLDVKWNVQIVPTTNVRLVSFPVPRILEM